MAQWIEALATKLDNLSFITRTHEVGLNELQRLFSDFYLRTVACEAKLRTHTNNQTNSKEIGSLPSFLPPSHPPSQQWF